MYEEEPLVTIDEVIRPAKESVTISRPYCSTGRHVVEAILCYNDKMHYAYHLTGTGWGEIHAIYYAYDDFKIFLNMLDISIDYRDWVKS